MSKQCNLSVRVPESMIKEIDAIAGEGKRSKWVIEALERALKSKDDVLPADLTFDEKRAVLRGAKGISDIMTSSILEEAQKRKNFLRSMTDEDFAKLVASRLPKERDDEVDVEAEVLSLESSLKMMPSIEDLTAELNRVKGELNKVRYEKDVEHALLLHSDRKMELRELMSTVYGGAVKYCVDMIARRNLPGFGDGGGISDKSYADIAREVGNLLEEVKVMR